MKPALIVHGHFYQPPRENPWTGVIDREPSAAPFHDWNERIHRECYRPNGWARIFDEQGAVEAIVDNYQHMSFDFGPTLASWLEDHEPATYRRVLDADKKSAAAHGGHGNAIAQGYNHAILPLMNDRDLRTQIAWGLGDFRHRFGRAAEGLWLPETACDHRTLGALIDAGLRFAILAPGQAARVRDAGGGWRDAGAIDPRRPYRFSHPDGSGRTLALFFYDGALSRGIAFEGLLTSSRALVDRFEQASGGPGTVVQACTDGESYGHHFKHGDLCLAHALEVEAPRRGVWITNYGELLDHLSPELEVDIALGPDGRGSSWSCAHGVGRWYRDCGCHTGGKAGWSQAWRTPLRAGLDVLADAAAKFFEEAAGALAADPWAMRDAYVELMVDRRADRAAFFERHCRRRLGDAEQVRALELCELTRSAMTIYTSCGWFFSDVSGIEAVQVLRYAGRLVDQLRELGGPDVEARMLELLAEAKSNLAERGTGADLYRAAHAGSRATAATIAAQIGIRRLVGDGVPAARAGAYRYRVLDERPGVSGRMRAAVSRLELSAEATGAVHDFACCAMHFGGVDVHCLVKRFAGDAAFARAAERIAEALASGSLLAMLRIAEEELGPDEFGVEHVMPSDREPLSRAIFAELFDSYAAHFEAMYRDSRGTMTLFHRAGLPIPGELRATAELVLGRRFEEALARLPAEVDERAYREAVAIADEARAFECKLPIDGARRQLEAALSKQLRRVVTGDTDVEHTGAATPLGAALALCDVADRLALALDLERPQELLYEALRDGLQRTPAVLDLADRLRLSRKIPS